MCVGDARSLHGALHPGRDGRPALRSVEERQRVDPVAEDGDAERLEQLARRADVEQRFHSRGDDQGGDPRTGAEVGGDVGRRREPAVHAAEPTGPHEADADRLGDGERAADRRCTERSLHRANREVARAELACPGS